MFQRRPMFTAVCLSLSIMGVAVLAGCSSDQAQNNTTDTQGTAASSAQNISGLIQIDGSSTLYPLSEAVAEDFQITHKGKPRVTIGVSGTGGGFKKFCRGETDISDASRPIRASEMKKCADAGIEFYEIPVAYDALTVVVNPKNTFINELTIDQLKRMWEPNAQGNVMTWQQVDPSWPAEKLSLYGPGADSGTFDYFTEAVVGEAKSSRGDFTASEDDNVLVQGVQQDQFGIGYFGYAYYAENKDKLKAVAIIDAPGKSGVLPSHENVMTGAYTPLSRPLFMYISKKSLENKPQVKAFVEFYLNEATPLAMETQFIPLPPNAYDTIRGRMNAGKVGTVFGGHGDTGVTIEELLSREPSVAHQ